MERLESRGVKGGILMISTVPNVRLREKSTVHCCISIKHERLVGTNERDDLFTSGYLIRSHEVIDFTLYSG